MVNKRVTQTKSRLIERNETILNKKGKRFVTNEISNIGYKWALKKWLYTFPHTVNLLSCVQIKNACIFHSERSLSSFRESLNLSIMGLQIEFLHSFIIRMLRMSWQKIIKKCKFLFQFCYEFIFMKKWQVYKECILLLKTFFNRDHYFLELIRRSANLTDNLQ